MQIPPQINIDEIHRNAIEIMQNGKDYFIDWNCNDFISWMFKYRKQTLF